MLLIYLNIKKVFICVKTYSISKCNEKCNLPKWGDTAVNHTHNFFLFAWSIFKGLEWRGGKANLVFIFSDFHNWKRSLRPVCCLCCVSMTITAVTHWVLSTGHQLLSPCRHLSHHCISRDHHNTQSTGSTLINNCCIAVLSPTRLLFYQGGTGRIQVFITHSTCNK